MSLREELEQQIAQARTRDEGFGAYEFLREHGQALLDAVADAEKWRKIRNAPLGIAGTPCVAMPKGERSGDFINGDDADAAVDGMPWPVAPTFSVSDLQELIVPFEIAHNVCGPDTEYARGYGDACGDIVHSVNEAIAARSKTVDGGGA